MVNSIKGNTISEANVKKKLNELKKIKKVETNGERLIESQKKLLSLFDNLLKTIFNKTVNENKSKSDNKSDYESDNENKNESENESENENENESDNRQYYLKQLNNNFKKIK